ncbi:MAG: hypothetical protein ACYSX0_09725 [Planctomycetota bacterium]|jgi:hypothetical protein
MSARGRLIGLLVLLLVVLVTLLVWRESREDRVAPRAGASREKASAPESESVEAQSRSESAGDRGAQAGDEASEVRVSGSVSLADGSPGPVGSVFVVGEVGGKRRMLNTRVQTTHGSFKIAFSFEGASSPWPIDVGLRTVGFGRRRRSLGVVPGGEYTVDFVLEKGSVLAGQVRDSAGNPVRGIEVFARSMQSPPWGLVTGHLIDPHRLLVGSGEETVQFSQGSTDASGRFELEGLPDGTYGLFSRSEEWILVHDGLLRPPDRTVEILALWARSVIGTVTDARTGRPLPRARAVLRVRQSGGRGSTKAVSVFEGRLWVVWRPAAGELEEVSEVEVRVTADGYRDGAETISFARWQRRGWIQLGLEPIAAPELGTTIVEVVDAWGRRVDLPVSFRLTATGPSDAKPGAFKVEPEGPGSYRLHAPEGRWSLRVWPSASLGLSIEWRGEVPFWSGRENALRCALPPFGTLHIRRTTFPEGSKAWVVGVESADGSASLLSQVETQGIRVAVEPGDWRVEITGLPETETRMVTVRPGEEVVVLFD